MFDWQLITDKHNSTELWATNKTQWRKKLVITFHDILLRQCFDLLAGVNHSLITHCEKHTAASAFNFDTLSGLVSDWHCLTDQQFYLFCLTWALKLILSKITCEKWVWWLKNKRLFSDSRWLDLLIRTAGYQILCLSVWSFLGLPFEFSFTTFQALFPTENSISLWMMDSGRKARTRLHDIISKMCQYNRYRRRNWWLIPLTFSQYH